MRPATLEQAKKAVAKFGFQSAIGHDATAEILSKLLEQEVSVNRIQWEQQPGEIALVFKLNARAPEGKILSVAEVEAIGFSFFFLYREKEVPRELRHIHATLDEIITDLE